MKTLALVEVMQNLEKRILYLLLGDIVNTLPGI